MRRYENKVYPRAAKGFTLVEMVIVIVVTGIIGGIVASFIRMPVQGYVDSARRAELTDIADTAVRRMARDIRTAVPNSVRNVACSPTCVEFLPTKDGGRYRAFPGGTNNVLSFVVADNSFEIIGSPIYFTQNVDYIVVGSTQPSGNPAPGDQVYNATAAGVLRLYTGTTGPQQATVTMNNTFPVNLGLPLAADLNSHRFDVVDGTQQAVTYACVGPLGVLDPNQNGQAKLVRYSLYGFNPVQVLPVTANPPILADKVSNCVIEYAAVNQRFGLLTVRLTLTSGGESVNLYNEIHVNNAP